MSRFFIKPMIDEYGSTQFKVHDHLISHPIILTRVELDMLAVAIEEAKAKGDKLVMRLKPEDSDD